ncbi:MULTISPECIES: iron uptake system protein EfeO [Mammaliicoccus]|jgi:iron uptake system component EfeO|uniref:Efem/EfeO family lipoprotein n=1 Tax=Mammaliicoccus lentus TaxID=42858 RepID=A0AAP1WMB7_MAMLE|nr:MULTISPECIES: iron uptake system protein EfeO [Mammaliicoccus]HBV03292.1 EfeM/EfeO family lipoprotein [Staphylococcus sp.]MBF0750144.1 EfeM/EfeO family lipoprotein [Mammaliicoccus lentus]MBF0795542.1 EfeM/EfeO family lipoprotein [Mammaliicoccus lentus]MBF0842086.1 EfeM/EfeO family lipoprotein [Mammaliicoccus lentus]MBU6113389.1 EfeM/EfeO family lipoprotein [Mammaliicoccus lentus]
MKRIATTLLASTLILTACGNDDEKKETNSDKETKETTKVDFSKETKAYKDFTTKQLDTFLTETEKFVEAVKADDVEKAKEIYPKARMYYERSEPVAESFGELDPKIDARLADMKEEKKENEWSGYHKIEKTLWEENSTKDMGPVADQLLKDVKELRAKVDTVDVTPKLMLQGSIDLLNEVSSSKITGEEEIYSHTDLYDFKANIEGAEKIFEIFKDKVTEKDKKVAETTQERFDNVNKLLAKYETKDGGYVDYTKLSKEDTKKLSEAVDKLGESLSQMAVITE